MLQSPFFRLLLAGQNPAGFDAIDFIALGLAVLLAAVLLARTRIVAGAAMLAENPRLSMALLAALPIVLRLVLLGNHPVPTPRGGDDFSYLLLGDTLAHFRLANATHPLSRFFEAVFVLQEPSYSSIFPLGQGMALAFGELVFRQPWAGVLLSDGLLCALCYWMLRAWVRGPWALLGGFFAVMEFGPLSPWMNTYWGGAVSGIAGCLVFGALPRLKEKPRRRDAVLLGIGLGLQALTRPFEFVLLLAIAMLFFAPVFLARWRNLAIAGLVLLPALGLVALQNEQVTGSWSTLPYQLSRYQYGIPAAFTVQPNLIPHRPLSAEQQVDYDLQAGVHGPGRDTVGSFLARLGGRLSFCSFFFPAPLYLALPAFLFALRERRFAWVAMALAIFWIGDNFYPYFYPHYVAAATCLFLLAGVKSLEILSGVRVLREAAALMIVLCAANFVFWYGVHLSGNRNLELALASEESWDTINIGDPEGRIAINEQLRETPGSQLVFVHYLPRHGPHDWIQNAAGIDRSRVVWAVDLGPEEDEKLLRYYPGRHAWMLNADVYPPRLAPYSRKNTPEEQ